MISKNVKLVKFHSLLRSRRFWAWVPQLASSVNLIMRSNIHQNNRNKATFLPVDDAEVPSSRERPQALHGSLQSMIPQRGMSAVLFVKSERRVHGIYLTVGQTGCGLSKALRTEKPHGLSSGQFYAVAFFRRLRGLLKSRINSSALSNGPSRFAGSLDSSHAAKMCSCCSGLNSGSAILIEKGMPRVATTRRKNIRTATVLSMPKASKTVSACAIMARSTRTWSLIFSDLISSNVSRTTPFGKHSFIF
jgi:hypothetical protein